MGMTLFFQWFLLKTPKDILHLGRNFLLWGWLYSSIGFLAKRLFAPWHKDLTSYGRGFDLKRFVQVFGWNIVSRFIGAFLRVFVIAFGLIAELLIAALTAVIFVAWYLGPALIAACLFLGFVTIFS